MSATRLVLFLTVVLLSARLSLRASKAASLLRLTPVSCNSAFGSIALVREDAINGEEYAEWAVIDGVEHWEFCRGVRANGYEVIADPDLKAEIKHKEEVLPHPLVIENNQRRLAEACAKS